MIDFRRPYTYHIWVNYFMPWIRDLLDIPNDDLEVVVNMVKNGIDNTQGITQLHLDNKFTLCFGAGPQLEEFTKRLSKETLSNFNIFSADGATMNLLENNIIPDAVLTDLDGLSTDRILQLINIGVKVLVLAHGDNKNQVNKLVSDLHSTQLGQVIWCTQGETTGNWVNTFGFTDGDRSASLAIRLNTIPVLAGYHLKSNYIGRYSKPPYRENILIDKRKQIKLNIAWKVIQWLNYNHKVISLDYKKVPGIELPLNQITLD